MNTKINKFFNKAADHVWETWQKRDGHDYPTDFDEVIAFSEYIARIEDEDLQNMTGVESYGEDCWFFAQMLRKRIDEGIDGYLTRGYAQTMQAIGVTR